jgi:hypothetical protein
MNPERTSFVPPQAFAAPLGQPIQMPGYAGAMPIGYPSQMQFR